MNFKESRSTYIPNSELERLSSQMADVAFDKYNNIAGKEPVTNYAVQYLVQYLEDTDDQD